MTEKFSYSGFVKNGKVHFMKPTLYSHKAGLNHLTSPNLPESPARLQAVFDVFAENPYCDWPQKEGGEISLKILTLAHEKEYLFALQDALPDRGTIEYTTDVDISAGSWDAAEAAAAIVCRAVDDMASGEINRAFCAARPPGHHAGSAKAEGFCLLNNVAIGALYAQTKGFKRVAIIDFDVHHGNGTEEIALKHDGVFYASTHEFPIYPFTGDTDSCIEGKIVDCPLPHYASSRQFHEAYENKILPALESFQPDLIFISAGFDAHAADPLASAQLNDEDYKLVTNSLIAIADKVCEGRIISVLEGGYNLMALKSGLREHLNALGGL
jgi:acetoin utilization deacetylase AcuC-like enzyme